MAAGAAEPSGPLHHGRPSRRRASRSTQSAPPSRRRASASSPSTTPVRTNRIAVRARRVPGPVVEDAGPLRRRAGSRRPHRPTHETARRCVPQSYRFRALAPPLDPPSSVRPRYGRRRRNTAKHSSLRARTSHRRAGGPAIERKWTKSCPVKSNRRIRTRRAARSDRTKRRASSSRSWRSPGLRRRSRRSSASER